MQETGDRDVVRAVVAALPDPVRLRQVVGALGLRRTGSKSRLVGRLAEALASAVTLERVLLESLRKPELRSVCRSLGLPSTGRKDELVARLRDRVVRGESEAEGEEVDVDDEEPPCVVSVLGSLLATLPADRTRELARALGLPSHGPQDLRVMRVALGVESDPASITRFLGGLRPAELRACAARVGLPPGGDAHVVALRLSAWIDLFRPEPPVERRASPRGLLLGRWRLGPARFALATGTVHEAVDVLLPIRGGCRAIVAHVPADRALKAEVEVGLGLAGPGLVRYLDHAVDEGGRDVAIVADPGVPLTAWLAEHGPVAPAQAARLTLGLAAALDGAHVEGALHGDVHPDAAWVAPDGPRPRLGALGLRRGRDGSADARQRARPPRPAWAAPEVARWGIATPASDQFGLALLFASLLRGEPVAGPAEAEGPDALRRALSADAGDRFSTCLDFALALLTS